MIRYQCKSLLQLSLYCVSLRLVTKPNDALGVFIINAGVRVPEKRQKTEMLVIVALFTVLIILGIKLLRWVVTLREVQRIPELNVFFSSPPNINYAYQTSVSAQIKQLALRISRQSFKTSRYLGQALQMVFVKLYWEEGAWSQQLTTFSSLHWWTLSSPIFHRKCLKIASDFWIR